MHLFGKTMSVSEVLTDVESDSAFYSRSGGGLTISGGEPLLQHGFTMALLEEAKKRRIDATIETCGLADWEALAGAAQYLKLILFDIKSVNPEKHKAFTGVSNEIILKNFKLLRQTFPQLAILARIPLIPGFNDSEKELGEILEFLRGMLNVTYEILPYHRMGQSKYQFLGRDYPMGDEKLSDDKAKELKAWAKTHYPGGK